MVHLASVPNDHEVDKALVEGLEKASFYGSTPTFPISRHLAADVVP